MNASLKWLLQLLTHVSDLCVTADEILLTHFEHEHGDTPQCRLCWTTHFCRELTRMTIKEIPSSHLMKRSGLGNSNNVVKAGFWSWLNKKNLS